MINTVRLLVESDIHTFFFFFSKSIGTKSDVPSVVFLNFGAEPQSAVGSTQESRTDHSKMKKVGHDNFKLHETGGDFSKRVVNTVEKGEIAP